jgi:hypothetical protein
MKFPLQMESKSVRETRILVQNIWLCMYLAGTSCQFLRVSLVKSNTCNSVCACLTLKWVLEREWLTDWLTVRARESWKYTKPFLHLHSLAEREMWNSSHWNMQLRTWSKDFNSRSFVRMGFYFHFQRMTGPYHDEFKITFWNVRKTLKDTI